MARMPISEFLWFNLLGTIPKSFILLIIGFYFGQAYATFDKFFKFAGWAAVLLVVLCVIAYIPISRFVKKYLKEE
jgi:membrane protein DedA with SNARE-associated domain